MIINVFHLKLTSIVTLDTNLYLIISITMSETSPGSHNYMFLNTLFIGI